MPRRLATLLASAALILSILACGSSNSGQAISTSAPGAAATAAPAKVQTYNVGDVVAVQDQTITLNSLQSGKIIRASFTIENTGSKDLAISSMMQFSAKASDGTKLEQNLMDCTSDLGGKVLPGDKLKGNVCWNISGEAPFKIYYEASLFGSGAIVWEVK